MFANIINIVISSTIDCDISFSMKYHLAIKQLKAMNESIQAEKMAESLMNNASRNFWSEVKKVRGSNKSMPNQIDGAIDPSEIANTFADKYKTIFNSVTYDNTDMHNLIKQLDDIMQSQHPCSCNHATTVDNIKQGIKHLRKGKHDGYMGHHTDHLIHGTDKLNTMLSNLFTSMLHHSFTPHDMLLATITPIPKDVRKSRNDSNNYRAIALQVYFANCLTG